MNRGYHHGDLHRAVLERAAVVIEADGPYAFSLRSLAADLGVSHTAPRHHFGDREGVLNALAAQGFRWLGDSLRLTRETGGSFLDLGVAYVDFALRHRAHFVVMFAPALLDDDDPELLEARNTAFLELTGGGQQVVDNRQTDDAGTAVIAGWSLVHGLATLAISGNLDRAGVRSLLDNQDLLTVARRSASLLFRPPPPPTAPATPSAAPAHAPAGADQEATY